MKTNSTRRSREEILDLYRAVSSKLGKPPGLEKFCTEAHLKHAEVYYYWASPGELSKEAGLQPNEYIERLPDADVFCDYAKVCLHLGKVPSQKQIRITQRELKTRTHTIYTRDGSIQAFQKKFRAWLVTSADDLKVILEFTGWAADKDGVSNSDSDVTKSAPQLHLFLPACIQYLDVLARGETPPFEKFNIAISTMFERRTADAFRCLGFEMKQFGQGTGRNADALACAPRERVALIIDAKVRMNGYSLGTEDRKFLDYAMKHGKELQKQGFEHLYLVVVAPSFRESDLEKLAEFLSESPIRSVAMITAKALMRIVEESIRNRSQFSLGDFSKQIFGNKIIQN
jgi:hypothetical protein